LRLPWHDRAKRLAHPNQSKIAKLMTSTAWQKSFIG